MNKLLLLLLFLSISASAKTIDIKDYATPNDGQNDRAGFQAAADDLSKNGGGTLIISAGTWDLGEDTVQFVGNFVAYKMVGDKGAVIRVSTPANVASFRVGNANSFEMRDLVFIGAPTGTDIGSLLNASYTTHLTVKGCRVYGVYSAGPMFYSSNVDAVYENNQFEGSGSDHSIVAGGGSDFRSITLRNNTFFDYANFNGVFYSKIGFPPAWVRVEPPDEPAIGGSSGATLVIDGNRFDEGAANAVKATNVRNVQIRNISVNVNGTDIGAGVALDNVKYGLVVGSIFGYTTATRPAVVLRNHSNVEVSKLDFGGGVYFGKADDTSNVFKIGICPACDPNPRIVSDTKPR